jgi:signal transduction histidine kinase
MGLLILAITIVYSNFLAENLKNSEEKNAVLYQEAMDYVINNPDLTADVSFQERVRTSFALPFIVKDEFGNLEGANFSEEQNQDSIFLNKKIKDFISSGQKPLKSMAGGYANEIYFFNSDLHRYIRYFPIVQLLLVASFVALGYYFFNASRKAEQNRVWVGMAKETAHQLGTPISAIIAWLEHLKEETNLDDEQNLIVNELKKDVDRLELVADRFSKIGSSPELQRKDIASELEEMASYMSKRAPRKVKFNYTFEKGKYFGKINAHLFNWVIENLIRNSLDSMDGEGTLWGDLRQEGELLFIELSDSGKGILLSKFKTVFQPGYSTKKRGWGLGLSLSKRIIEEYHGGKISVLESIPGVKTTFLIKLPVA